MLMSQKKCIYEEVINVLHYQTFLSIKYGTL